MDFANIQRPFKNERKRCKVKHLLVKIYDILKRNLPSKIVPCYRQQFLNCRLLGHGLSPWIAKTWIVALHESPNCIILCVLGCQIQEVENHWCRVYSYDFLFRMAATVTSHILKRICWANIKKFRYQRFRTTSLQSAGVHRRAGKILNWSSSSAARRTEWARRHTSLRTPITAKRFTSHSGTPSRA